MGHTVCARVYQHTSQINALLNEQYGFRSNSSEENVSCKLINEILLAVSNKLTVRAIFCDSEKTFDCVNHNILLSKLNFYGIVGKFCMLMRSLLTYLLTSWYRVLLEKLTGLQLVKKFPKFHGTRKFITALTSVHHLSLSWASPIQSIYPHPTSWRSIQILSTHLCLGLPSGLFSSGFPTKTLYTPLSSPIHAQPIPFFPPTQYWVRNTNHLASHYASSSIPPLPRPS